MNTFSLVPDIFVYRGVSAYYRHLALYVYPLVSIDEEGEHVRLCIVIDGIEKPRGEDKTHPANGKMDLQITERCQRKLNMKYNI